RHTMASMKRLLPSHLSLSLTRLAIAMALCASAVVSIDAIRLEPHATQPAQAAQSSLPPLIDRELFFGNPEIATGTISPDGKFVAFRKPWNGTMNIWVKGAAEPFAQAKRLTADTKRPIPAFFWSRDSKYILFVQDQAGDENYNVYAVSPTDPPDPGTEVPKARNVTEAKNARAQIYDVPR